MSNALKNCRLIAVSVLLTQASATYSTERVLDARVSARIQHNDNIFLVPEPEGPVTGVTITPAISGIIRDSNWETRITAKLSINKYSDRDLDSNDQFFNLSGRYQKQLDIFSLDINHDLTSNLNSSSVDSGLSRTRIKRKTQSISPVYTRLLTERLRSTFSYIYSDVDFLDAEGTNFTPYIIQTGIVSLQYSLTEKDNLSFNLRAVDYESKDKLTAYQLLITNIAIAHTFSETLSSNFQVGVTRQNSTNLRTQTVDFFGQIIELTREIDSKNRGLNFNVGLTKLLENSSLNANISRSDTTNSFGGLDITNSFVLSYDNRINELWRYEIRGVFSDVTLISTGAGTSDRDVFNFDALTRYTFSPNWNFTASYQYSARRFKSDTSENRAPHSNKIFVTFSYNFPSLSTF